MKKTECEDLYSLVYGYLAEDDALREEFLTAEQLLSLSFLLVKHIDSCRKHADEVIFYQCVRKQIAKAMPGKKPPKELERAVRDLVDESVESVGVVDIFKAAGIEKADLSILDDQFLQTFKDRPQPNLRLKLLEQLMRDEIQRRQRTNLAQAKSFQALLAQTLLNYHNRLIDAAAVIQALMAMRKEMSADDARAKELNLEPDELAFYDVVAANYATIYEPGFLRDLIHDVVQTLKKNLKVDWAAPHRQQVYSAIRAAVQRTLQRRGVQPEHLEPITTRVMEQAAATFKDWPTLAA
jgi:type I restriction enzyme, R subunit